MSANNQTLIKEHKGKFYVFPDIMAESWGEVNEIRITGKHPYVFNTRDEAYHAALGLDADAEVEGQFGPEGTEYGVQFNRLCKDDAEVKLIEGK